MPQHCQGWHTPFGVGEVKTVAVVGIVEMKAAAEGFVLNNLDPRAGTGDTGREQSAMHCVARRAVAVVSGEFDFEVT